jgi:hypothetical protein
MATSGPRAAGIFGEVHLDSSSLFLLGANLITIVIALVEGWDLGTLIFIYWFQSVTIGVFTVVRILRITPEQVGIKPGTDTGGVDQIKFFPYGRVMLAGFFAVHYGLFHLAYYDVMSSLGLFANLDFFHNPDLLLVCTIFFLNHFYSYRFHREEPYVGQDYLGELLIKPYFRIIPMHITVIVGGAAAILLAATGFDATRAVMVCFLLLKTGVDLQAHQRKHDENVDQAGE